MSRAGAQPTEQERAAAAAVLQMNAMAAETGHAPAAPETGPVTPDAIMEVARGFMAAKHLFAASSIGIFEALAGGPATLAEIAARAGISERAAHISADAMVALGFLNLEQGHYSNGPVASTFLAGRTPADLRPVLRFWDLVKLPGLGPTGTRAARPLGAAAAQPRAGGGLLGRGRGADGRACAGTGRGL